MPVAALIALAEQYGPTVFGLAIKYGPTVVSLIKQYGPEIEAQVLPLVEASADAGTLEQDAAALVSGIKALAPMIGPLTSLADVAAALDSIQPVDAGNPTPDQDRLARPDRKGGR